MPKIHLLDKQIAELIAAGEVVERPASVIKELVENAVDAGATSVIVEIRNGGVTFMRVTDNGCGITREDVPTAFLRHATSKIHNANDLNAIGTLGFRGEALASISAVSKLEMMTRTEDSDIGIRYSAQGGEHYELDDVGCPVGTTIIIRDLFFNVPARMKFLKKDVTEGNAVAGIIDKIALSHPEISMRLIRDGKELLHTPGDNKLLNAIYVVFGRQFSETMMPVDYTLDHIKVWGYVSAPKAARANRSMQNFFINGRYIKSRTAGVALDESCKGSIMVGKFASCVLNIDIALETVDVNVHPAKLEVRFVNERPIFDAVYHAVKTALQNDNNFKEMELKQHDPLEKIERILDVEEIDIEEKETPSLKSAEPSIDIENRESFVPVFQKPQGSTILRDSDDGFSIRQTQDYRTQIGRFIDIEVTPEDIVEEESKPAESFQMSMGQTIENLESNTENSLVSTVKTFETHKRFIGEIFSTYIILEYGDNSMMLIDKHAAHERLIYEKLRQTEKNSSAQVLLEPVTVTLEKNEYDCVLSNLEILADAGYEVEDFGSGIVLVRTVPLYLDKTDVDVSIMEIAGYLKNHKTEVSTEHLEWLYHNIACRAAMKGGDNSSKEELIALAKKLEENPKLRYCPHGRPISIVLKRQEIEKQFGRIG